MTEEAYADRPATEEELAELDADPAEEATEEVELADAEEIPEVADDDPEVTEANYIEHLPPEGSDDSAINQILSHAPQGVLSAEVQAEYLERGPDPQEDWVDGDPT